MGGQRWLKSVGEASNTLYTRLLKPSVVTQALFACPVDSGLGKT